MSVESVKAYLRNGRPVAAFTRRGRDRKEQLGVGGLNANEWDVVKARAEHTRKASIQVKMDELEKQLQSAKKANANHTDLKALKKQIYDLKVRLYLAATRDDVVA